MQPATRRALRLLTLPLAATALGPSRAAAQSAFTWNNAGTAWQSAASWNPHAVPTSSDAALFGAAGSATGTATTGPSVSGSVAVQSLTAGLSQNFGGWNFGGSGTLTLSLNSPGLRTEGPQTTTFNGPTLAGASTAGNNSLSLTVAGGSTLVFSGATAVTNLGSLAVYGTFRLDNATNSVANRLDAAKTVTLSGGTIELVGNATAAAYTVGSFDNLTNAGGVNTVRVTPLSTTAATVLQFSNADAGSTGGFSSRLGLRAVTSYEATAGNLGDPSGNGAQVRFVGTPYSGTNGLLTSLKGTVSVGFAVVKDAGGTDFAAYTANGVTRAGATSTATDAAGLNFTAASRGQFNPAGGSTAAAAATLTTGSLRVTPAGAGATLAMGGFNLATTALMLDGPHDFALTGTGTLSGSGTRYVHVNNAAATLSTSLVVASGSNSTVFAGPGFVDLTGAGSQNALSGTSALGRFVVAGGTVRANTTQVGFTLSGVGIVSLTGGVLEIKGGMNGTGASADFTRAVGGSAEMPGAVSWGASSSQAAGGGFSAFGAAASVNLGGAAAPTALTWNQPDFVPADHPLKFGSTQSNAVLTWYNPIVLDAAGNVNPTAREFRVVAGTGGDRTVLAGVVSGVATTDFLKTGTGNLVLGAANTYAGKTLVHGGTLTLGVANAIAPAGGIFLGNATLSSGVAGGFSANLGALSLTTGTPTVALGTGSHTLSFTTLAVNVPGLTVTGFTGTRGASGTGGRLVFTGLGSSSAANGSFASFLAGTSFTGYPLGAAFIASGANLELVPAPVPEPATVLGLAALGLGATGLLRRLRARTPRN